MQAKDQETNTEAESTDDDEEPGVTSHEVHAGLGCAVLCCALAMLCWAGLGGPALVATLL